MKKFPAVFVMLTAACCLAAVMSCGDDDPATPGDGGNGGGPGPADPVVQITDDIHAPRTFSADSVYLIMKYDFYVEATLTIQPGTVVKFHPSSGPYCMIGGGGTINATGTALAPIVFTSYKDDAHGGDTNGDGSASSPARRDWGEINTNGNNGSDFVYCEFYYGGAVGYNATLTVYGNNISVVNCKFINNDGSYTSSAGDIGVLDASDGGNGVVIQGNTFYNNIRPLSMSTAFNLNDSNVFHNPDNPSQTNTYNGIFVETIDHITANRSWQETEVAYVIDDNDFWINSGYRLTLGNDVVLKFKSGSVMLLSNGSWNINNYNGTGVYFTSWKDDAHKGDTNGDGPSNGAPDDWVGIYDDSMSIPAPHYFTWGNILYDSY